MAITKQLKNGKVSYDVFVKVRDKTGKQVSHRRRSISSERDAKRIEFELKCNLQDFKTMTTWGKWSEHFLARYKIEYRNSTYMNYKFNIENSPPPFAQFPAYHWSCCFR